MRNDFRWRQKEELAKSIVVSKREKAKRAHEKGYHLKVTIILFLIFFGLLAILSMVDWLL